MDKIKEYQINSVFVNLCSESNPCNNIYTRRKSSQSLPVPPAPSTVYKMLGVHAFSKELQKSRKVCKVWKRT